MDQTSNGTSSGAQAPAYGADERHVDASSVALKYDPVLADLVDYGEG